MEQDENKSQDVAVPDQIASGTAVTGQENEELEWMKRHTKTSIRQAEKKTGLRGQGIDPVRRSKRALRSRTERELLVTDSDVPYAAVEKANRDLVCSLIERQDRVTENLLLMINDLQYRIDDLESGTLPTGTKKSGIGREVQE